MTWRAVVVEDFPRKAVRLHLGETGGDYGRFIVQIGPDDATVVRSVPANERGPEGMSLPREACEPLRDALDVFLGRKYDDYRSRYEEARDALETERRRVDRILGEVYDGGQG